MPEAEAGVGLIKTLTTFMPLGTNVFLLIAVIVIFRAWRQDLATWNSTLSGMVTRYENFLERTTKVLTSLEEKIE